MASQSFGKHRAKHTSTIHSKRAESHDGENFTLMDTFSLIFKAEISNISKKYYLKNVPTTTMKILELNNHKHRFLEIALSLNYFPYYSRFITRGSAGEEGISEAKKKLAN